MQEGRKEEGSLLSLTRSPRCRINRMEEGAAGGVPGLWTQTLPRMLVALPQIKPWPFFRTAGLGPACRLRERDGSALSQQACPHSLGRGRWAVFANGVWKESEAAEPFSSLTL